MSQTEDKYGSLLDHLPDGYALHQVVLDDSGRPIDYVFLDVNPAFERLTGLSQEALAGKRVTAVLPGIERSGFDWIGTFGKVALDGGTTTFAQYLEHLERWYEVTAYRESPGRFVTLFHDVTPRRSVEDALFESETRYRALFQLSSEAAYLVTLDGRLLEVNQAWHDLFGYTRDDLSTMTIRALYADPEQREREFLSMIEADGRMLDWQVRFKKKDGTVIDCICNVVARRDEAGNIMYLQGLVRDASEEKRQREALADELNRRRILLEQSRDGIVVLDEDGKVFEANRRFAQMIGYSPEELLRLHVWDWDVPTPPDKLKEMVKTVDESGDHFETQHRRKDGSIYDVEISTNGAMFASRKLIFCVCRDISTRKLAEDALHKSEERYRSLFEQSLDAVYIGRPDGSLIDVNQSWLDLFGYTREDLPFINAVDVNANPAERTDHIRRMAEVGFVKDEVLYRRKDGSKFLCQRHQVAHRDESGTVITYQGVMRDISELRRAEQALKDSEEKYRALFEQSMDAIALVAADGRIQEANESWLRLFGYSASEIRAFDTSQMYVEPDALERLVGILGSHGELVNDAVKLRRKDGKVMDCLRHASGRHGSEGQLIGYQMVVRDVTRQVQDREMLERSRQEFQRLAQHQQVVREQERADVAWELHDEVGQALSVVSMDLASLRANLPTDAPAETHSAIDRTVEVLYDTIARLRKLYTELRPGMLDDLGLCDTIEWQTAEFARNTGIECTVVRLDAVALPDAGMNLAMYRVFQEALDNIMRHSGATRAEVSVEREPDFVTVRITDNGRGITIEDVESPASLDLIAMRERMRGCGGHLTIRNGIEGGTVVEASMPLTPPGMTGATSC